MDLISPAYPVRPQEHQFSIGRTKGVSVAYIVWHSFLHIILNDKVFLIM